MVPDEEITEHSRLYNAILRAPQRSKLTGPPKLLKIDFRFYGTDVYAPRDSAWSAAAALGEQWSTLDWDGARQLFGLKNIRVGVPRLFLFALL